MKFPITNYQFPNKRLHRLKLGKIRNFKFEITWKLESGNL